MHNDVEEKAAKASIAHCAFHNGRDTKGNYGENDSNLKISAAIPFLGRKH